MEDNNIEIGISDKPLSLDKAYLFVLDECAGGNCIFIGTTRTQSLGESITHLDFESYIPMAEKEMKKIAETAIETFNVLKIAFYHRTGIVKPEEIAVVIAVSSVHRKESFQACEYIIDTLKKTVPIWKKEFLETGEVWVNSHP